MAVSRPFIPKGDTLVVNVSLVRPGLGSIRSLPRTIAQRWSVLIVVTVAAALPVTATFAASNPGVFTGDSNVPAIRASNFEREVITAHGGGSTAVSVSNSGSTTVDIENTSRGRGMHVESRGIGIVAAGLDPGVQGSGVGVQAFGDLSAVDATSAHGTGVKAKSTSGVGVDATSDNSIGASGTGKGEFGIGVAGGGDDVGVQGNGINVGVRAHSFDGNGVVADSNKSAAVLGQSTNGLGGEFSGGEAPLRLVPSATVGAPKTGTHHKGELYVDSNGDLFYCKADGTSGTWMKVTMK